MRIRQIRGILVNIADRVRLLADDEIFGLRRRKDVGIRAFAVEWPPPAQRLPRVFAEAENLVQQLLFFRRQRVELRLCQRSGGVKSANPQLRRAFALRRIVQAEQPGFDGLPDVFQKTLIHKVIWDVLVRKHPQAAEHVCVVPRKRVGRLRAARDF